MKALVALSTWLGSVSRHAAPRHAAMLVFTAAALVRLVALLLVPDAHLSSNATESILPGADQIRRGAFVGNPDFPMLVPPLAALFVAVIQELVGSSLAYVKIGQIVLDAAAVALVYGIGRQTVGPAAALLGAALLVVYPFAVFVPLYIGTESLFGFLLALAMFCVIKGMPNGAPVWFLAGGAALGLATLTRGTTLFLPFVLVPYLVWYFRGDPKSRLVPKCALLIAGFALVLSPWVVRNLIVHDAFIPSSTSSGPFLHGSSEEFWLIADRERELPKYFDRLRTAKGWSGPATPTWVEKDRFYRRAALEKYKERWETDPWSFGPFIARKFLRLWYATESGSNIVPVIAINLPLYLLALVGLWRLLRSPLPRSSVLLVLLAYFVVMHVVVFGYFRYMVPVMAYVTLIAAYGACGVAMRAFGLRGWPAGP